MIEAIILGIVQGITEFLPVSSSAHLIIFREVFNIGASISKYGLAFDLALHVGTLLAVIIFFFNDLWKIFINGVTKPKENKLFFYLIVATIPAAIAGILLEDIIDAIFRNNLVIIGFGLIIMGIVLFIADTYSKENKSLEKITLKDAILIGIMQTFALIPGFSRSGTTISTARILKISREDATKFSFFLSIPVIAGGALLKLLKHSKEVINHLSIFSIGTITSFIVGILTIKFLLKYLKKNDFSLFMIWRILLGLFIIFFVIFK